jgi:translocator protein
VTFFKSLIKPSWIPPDWAFPLAWFSLWALQAFALARLSQSNHPSKRLAVGLMIAQFVTSIMWQAVIFGPGRLLFSAWWLTAVLVLVLAATIACLRVDRLAGLAVAPTCVWVSVATALAWSLHRLNPGA